ncbi:MAG: hypothetical protein ACTSU4_06630 [Promethearchaeota archaeon]
MFEHINTAWAIPWYTTMVIINVMSVVYCAIVYKKSLLPRDGKDLTYRKWMRIMGVIVTLVSAYRAIGVWCLPYTFRIPNTFAEVSFAGLIAYAMLKFDTYIPPSEDTRANKFKSFITKTPYILVGCIVLAQPIDTWGGITHFALTSVLVETLWGIGFLSILPLAIMQLRRVFSIKDKEKLERFRIMKYSSVIIATWCVMYCIYRWIFTLPAMWASALSILKTGLPPPETGLQAIIDALGFRTRTSLEYRDWGFGFLIWFSAYFSILTWISIFLMQAPRPREISGKHDAKETLITLALAAIAVITLITIISLPADIDEKIMLIILGGIILVPIVYIFVSELKRVKLKTTIE